MPIQYILDSNCCEVHGISCCWIVPDGVKHVTFELWGGGGGGGNAGTNCNCCQSGGPGMGGAYARKSINVTPGDYYYVCAGSGGMTYQEGEFTGAPVNICCNGISGGNSFVIGVGLTNFCAEGGCGGRSDFGINCYSYCGCMFFSSGTPGISATAYGYDYHAHSNGGLMHLYADGGNPYTIKNWGGNGAGPGGGGAGYNHSGMYNCWGGKMGDNSWGKYIGFPEPMMHGRIPGGGGAGQHFQSGCNCNPGRSGPGAPGMVKITY